MSDHRYKETLQEELQHIGETHTIAELEKNELLISSCVKYDLMKSALTKYFGKELSTARGLLFAKIKNMVYDTLRKHTNGPPYIKYSVFLSESLHYSYPYLSNLFSQMHGSSLEQYIIAQRIELVKHLLVVKGLGLSEIAWKLGYCSVPHLSNQFKKITGSSPTKFRSSAQHTIDTLPVLCGSCGQTWVVPTDSGARADRV
jgi:YesN/AraC family two-component response regulator